MRQKGVTAHIVYSVTECSSPGTEGHSVLVVAPAASIRHLQQMSVPLEDLLGGLDPIEDYVVIYYFLKSISQRITRITNYIF